MSAELLTLEHFDAARPELHALLRDAVEHGASVGFVLPLPEEVVAGFWDEVRAGVASGAVRQWVVRDAGRVVGGVQLHLAGRPNGRARAEVAKMLVHSSQRRRGFARILLSALEEEARRLGRTTLVLDTVLGAPAEEVYRRLGWSAVGSIPAYALSVTGTPEPNIIFYKLLS